MKGSASQPNTSPLPHKGHTQADKALLSLALGKVCALQKQYGKTAAELETLVEGFCWILEDYPMPAILQAMKTYVAQKADIPTPADLKAIIDPPPQPLSRDVYVKYQKLARDGQYLLSDERAYCRAYEAQEHAKARGGSQALRSAQAEIAHHAAPMLEYAGDDE